MPLWRKFPSIMQTLFLKISIPCLLDIFENRQLKQAMEYVDSRVILSTVHGAKGLEWDYVVVCDVEQWVFTFICRDCPSKSTQGGARCRLPQNIPTQMVEPLLDDLCVFYVALTRAKKQVFISASGERYNAVVGNLLEERFVALL